MKRFIVGMYRDPGAVSHYGYKPGEKEVVLMAESESEAFEAAGTSDGNDYWLPDWVAEAPEGGLTLKQLLYAATLAAAGAMIVPETNDHESTILHSHGGPFDGYTHLVDRDGGLLHECRV